MGVRKLSAWCQCAEVNFHPYHTQHSTPHGRCQSEFWPRWCPGICLADRPTAVLGHLAIFPSKMTQHFRFLINISEPDICEPDEHSPFIPRFDHSSLKKCNHFCRSEDDLFRNDDHEKLIHYIQRYSTDLSTPAVRGQPDDPTYLVVSLRAQAPKK